MGSLACVSGLLVPSSAEPAVGLALPPPLFVGLGLGVGALLLHSGPEWIYWMLAAVISVGVFIWAFRKSEHAPAH